MSKKNAGPQFQGARFVRACAVETHMHISQSHFVWKCPRKIPHRVSLRSRNAHVHFTNAILCGNLQEKCRTPIPGTAGQTHMDISQEQFCVEIYRKMPDPLVNTSIEHRAFYTHRKNPFSVATLFGEKHRKTKNIN